MGLSKHVTKSRGNVITLGRSGHVASEIRYHRQVSYSSFDQKESVVVENEEKQHDDCAVFDEQMSKTYRTPRFDGRRRFIATVGYLP